MTSSRDSRGSFKLEESNALSVYQADSVVNNLEDL